MSGENAYNRIDDTMRLAWVTRSFLDYRVPVYAALNYLADGNLKLVYYRDYVPERVCKKATSVLGENAVGLTGEIRLLGKMRSTDGFANSGVRVPVQPGLIREVHRHKPDVVISDGFFQWTYAALWLKATRGIPHVMCYEKTAHTERNAQWYRKVYRKSVLRWIDAICCTGRLCGEYVQSLGYPANMMTYGHMVADVKGMQRNTGAVTDQEVSLLRKKYDLRGPVFLYVGRLVPLKGVKELLAAWARLETTLPPNAATLLLVGDGPRRGELEGYCSRVGLSHVRFAGHIDYDSLASYYKAADVFVIPTLEDNWSLVVSEAMSCGLPILCSKYNGCWPELVRPENGWVFDPLCEREFAAVLGECLAKKDCFKTMGRASVGLVAQYTPENAAQSILRACQMASSRTRASSQR